MSSSSSSSSHRQARKALAPPMFLIDFQKWTFYEVSLLCFLFVNSLASTMNHIDDTDETYGYWEPLHYMLFREGMQTWEYSPEYALRTYTFIVPLVPIGHLLAKLGMSRLNIFYTIRLVLGICTAYCEATFADAICERFGTQTAELARIFLVLSPGIFYSSTSYLPSAVGSSLLMLALAFLLKRRHIETITIGCIAVIWTGWPFIALLFIPLGIQILHDTYTMNPEGGSIAQIVKIIVQGIIVLLTIVWISCYVDCNAYNKWTFPPLNIFIYNVFGGSEGDELYGIEPVSYYIKALVLNTGLVFPISCLSIPGIMLAISWGAGIIKERITILSSVFLWLLVLFSRPHKEERFLYPAYPILCLVAADVLRSLVFPIIISMCDRGVLTQLSSESSFRKSSSSVVNRISTATLNAAQPPSPSPSSPHPTSDKEPEPSSSPLSSSLSCTATTNPSLRGKMAVQLMLYFIVIFSSCMGIGRIMSNYKNYSGILKVWNVLHYELHERVSFPSSSSSSPSISSETKSKTQRELNLCMGNDWYTFPSHFFLPKHIKLRFIEESFRGVLPQYYAEVNGTFATPAQPFNNRNLEERSRYIPIDTCDYIIYSDPADSDDESNKNVKHEKQSYKVRKHTAKNLQEIISFPIIDSNKSPMLTRAFFIPTLSSKLNKYGSYSVYCYNSRNGRSVKEHRDLKSSVLLEGR